METFDLAIIGGSISGLSLAYWLRDSDLRIAIFEEDKNIGFPLKCSGIVSERILDIFPELPKNIIEKRIGLARIFCENKDIELEVNALILNRPKLENWLFKKLEKKGIIFIWDRAERFYIRENLILRGLERGGAPFQGAGKDFPQDRKIAIKTKSKEYYLSKYIAGCDGCASITRRFFVDENPKRFYFAKFCYAKGKMPKELQVFLDRDYSEFFAWKFPRKKYIEYGLATKNRLYDKFERFIQSKNAQIEEVYGGTIPIGPTKSYFKYGLLIGDACAQTKPLTGGGIIYSLIASQIASEIIKKKNPNFKEYEKKWKKILGKEIRYQMLIRRMLEKMNNKNIVKLLTDIEKLSIENIKDYDFPITANLSNISKLTLAKLFLKYFRFLF